MDSMDIARARAYHRRRKAERREQRETLRQHWLSAVRSAVAHFALRFPGVKSVHPFGSFIETVLACGKRPCGKRLYERGDSLLEGMATL